MTAARPSVALVTGANSGIGLALIEQLLARRDVETVYAGCRSPGDARALRRLADDDARLRVTSLDITDDASVEALAAHIAASGHLDLVINTAGILHDDNNGLSPERRLADVQATNLQRAFDVNAVGTLRLAKALEPYLRKSQSAVFASLSARVGSISDNRLGGWYAYRASKAALNMMLKTLSIEWARLRPAITCAALHPGTVATHLSAPFTGKRDDLRLFSPPEAATNLLNVIVGLTPVHSGRFFAWDGAEIPW